MLNHRSSDLRIPPRVSTSADWYNLSPYDVTPPQNTVWPPCCSVLDAAVAATQQNWHDTGKGVPQSAFICTASRGRPHQADKSKHWSYARRKSELSRLNTLFGSLFFLASL